MRQDLIVCFRCRLIKQRANDADPAMSVCTRCLQYCRIEAGVLMTEKRDA